jgi:hypothetical protein
MADMRLAVGIGNGGGDVEGLAHRAGRFLKGNLDAYRAPSLVGAADASKEPISMVSIAGS